MIRAPIIFLDIDLPKHLPLPLDWDRRLMEAASTASIIAKPNAASSTTRKGDTGLRYGVITGDRVRTEYTWLFDAYVRQIPAFIDAETGLHLRPAHDWRSGININVYDRTSHYDWHVDSNPYTGLLFVTPQLCSEGGWLVFDQQSDSEICGDFFIQPRRGRFLLFDATETSHTVTKIHGHGMRLSVPMNYYPVAQDIDRRPADLDAFLYDAGRSVQ